MIDSSKGLQFSAQGMLNTALVGTEQKWVLIDAPGKKVYDT